MLSEVTSMIPGTIGEWIWFCVGLCGQFTFFMRFVVQWIASERKKRTVVPMAFWYLSLCGTLMVLAYAIYKADPVFIAAYSLNIFIYVRNLHIAQRCARDSASAQTPQLDDLPAKAISD
ncbi:MAG: hypothetical protein GXY38_09460 [Planctomycetes bacterium]|jgi:lipid-A-disaccharide synthase-like uncharacterized protein|nr:hypothetical protein [Planctomycetota bacterium]